MDQRRAFGGSLEDSLRDEYQNRSSAEECTDESEWKYLEEPRISVGLQAESSRSQEGVRNPNPNAS